MFLTITKKQKNVKLTKIKNQNNHIIFLKIYTIDKYP